MPGLTQAIAKCIANRMRWVLEPNLSDDEWDILVDDAIPPGTFAKAMQVGFMDQTARDTWCMDRDERIRRLGLERRRYIVSTVHR